MPATIVIVDEDRAFVGHLSAVLRRAGYEVIGCVGSDEAVRVFETYTRPVDLAIIDFMVPGTSGPEMIGALQRRMPAAKIIATVPGEGPDLTEHAARMGVTRVIKRPPKGIPPEGSEWVSVVRKALGDASTSAA
jgi:DNA-binding NtrC family response regulator